jgi:hypothetical protein
MTITLSKADSLLSNIKVPDIFIDISSDLPACKTLEDSEKYYEAQAIKLEDALYNVLPQGVLDRLIIKLMERKTSLYRGITR